MIQKEKSVFEKEVLEVINEDRKENDKKPLPPQKQKDEKKRKKKVKQILIQDGLIKVKKNIISPITHTQCVIDMDLF
ncbi:hypothetical protein KHQ89_04290 [Mycoplasmatota bacterium]|nr:hypothetical protein KHQ89_04290 [Mycoplasmatota bacterium]